MSDSYLTVQDLAYGDFFDYDLIRWKAIGEHDYRWDDGTFSHELKISGGGETRYLEIEDEDDEHEMRVMVSRKIRLGTIDEKVDRMIVSNGSAPATLTYHGKKYQLETSSAGSYKDIHGDNVWENFEVWDYIDDSQRNVLSIERWEGNEFEAYVGKIVSPREFTNITKGEPAPAVNISSWKNFGWIAALLFFVFQFFICSKNSSGYSFNKPEGLESVLAEYASYSNFSVILKDMDYDNGEFSHNYQVLIPKGDSVEDKTTGWKEVSRSFFKKHQNHLGLEIANKMNNNINRHVAPPGYSHFVGNEKYGSWEEKSDGSRFWQFYAQYAMLRLLFDGFERPRYSGWNRYNTNMRGRGNYYGYAKQYNSGNYLISNRGRNTRWSQMPASLQKKAREEAARTGGSSGGRYSRTGNRYSNSGSRSRSGGYGK